MSQTKPYDVIVNGMQTTLMLSDADAANRGLEYKERKAPPNKSRTASNKARKPAGARAAATPAATPQAPATDPASDGADSGDSPGED